MDDPLEKSEANNKLGNSFYMHHQYTNAIYEYTKAIKTCPQIAKYYSNRSACYLMLNEYVKALSDAIKAIELDKGYRKAYIRIGTCCLAYGDLNYAETTLAKAKGIFHDDKEIISMYNSIKNIQKNLQQFETNMENKKFEEALKYIDNCLKEAPNCTKYMTNKGRCLIYLQKYSEAEMLADNILKYNSTDDDAIFIKLAVQIYQEDAIKAAELAKELKKKLPDHLHTVKLYRNTSMISKNDIEIKKALQAKNYCKAYDLLSQSIKIDEHRKLYIKKLYKQKIYIAGKDKNLLWNGIDDCTTYMDIFKDREMLKVRGEYYFNLEEYEDALEDFKEIEKFNASNDIKRKIEITHELLKDQLINNHKILKISSSATKDEIKKASNELMRRYHPDKNNRATPARKKLLEQRVIRVRNAADILLKAAR